MSCDEPLLRVEGLASVARVQAVRFDVEYEPLAAAQPPGWQGIIEPAVTVVFDAHFPEAATMPAATADLLRMRGCGPQGQAPPELGPAQWRARWWYQQPPDAAATLQLHVQLSGLTGGLRAA